MTKALHIKNLTKTYSNGLKALKDISIDIEQGDFFALLGPNGKPIGPHKGSQG